MLKIIRYVYAENDPVCDTLKMIRYVICTDAIL